MDWSLNGIAALATAIGVPSGLAALYKLLIEHGRKLEREKQTKATLEAKDEEIAALRAELAQYKEWVDALTRPPGRSS